MTKKLILMAALMAITGMVCAQAKKVAVMETKVTQGVTPFQSQMVRGGMETAVANAPGYEGYDRAAFDVIMQEQNFQRSGAVDDKQIRELGVMAGVQYVLVTEASKEDGYFYILAKLLDVETGRFVKSSDQLCEATPTHIREACAELGVQLFGTSGTVISNRPQYQQPVVSNQSYKQELQLSDGRYVGEVSNGKPHGKGILYYKSGNQWNVVSYEGDWVNGNKTGNGVMIWKNGDRHEGGWKNGSRSGYGVAKYANGNRYEGNYENDKRFGQGTFYWQNGDKYVGNFDDKMNGQGTYYYSNGNRYVGNWENDKMHGQGTYYYSNGGRFVGNYENGKRNGYGTEYFSGNWEGDRREGYWNDDKMMGKATYYWSDGDVDYENYVDSKKEGEFTRVKADGRRLKATYRNDEIIVDWH